MAATGCSVKNGAQWKCDGKENGCAGEPGAMRGGRERRPTLLDERQQWQKADEGQLAFACFEWPVQGGAQDE